MNEPAPPPSATASRGMLMTVREKGAERQKQEREEKTLGPSRSNEETACYPAVRKVHARALCAHCAFHFKLHTGAGGGRTPSEAAGCVIPVVQVLKIIFYFL